MKKNNTYTHFSAALNFGCLAIVICAMAITLNSCQDYEYGFTEEEIHQVAIERNYIKAFNAEFPTIDPAHTWMCTPDTIFDEVEVEGQTRAHSGKVPSVYSENVFENMSYTDVKKALDYMKEAVDNRDNCAQDFEYKAIVNDGDGFEIYTITPTFWGRKFCNTNWVGLYYIGSDENRYNLDPFWNDQNSQIEVYYKDGSHAPAANSEQQIVDDPDLSNYELSIPLTHACQTCKGNNIVSTSIKVKDKNGWNNNPATVKEKSMQNCYKVEAVSNNNTYNSQLFVITDRNWQPGESYRFHMWAKASKNVTIEVQVQTGSNGDYNGMLGVDASKRQITEEWTEIVWEGTIPQPANSGKAINTLTLCLAQNDADVTYYFSDIIWEHGPLCANCVGGKSPVDHYQLPQYTIKMPVGMKWGVYLKTKKQQKDDTSDSNMITWYSNSKYNANNTDGSNTNVKAAATFTYERTTYVSFEDAPTVCSNTDGTGICTTCGRGHYDHDYNDIVLTINPRPVESTYRSIKYRVMCEDLGGTFDWDFNDVVYDVIYEDGKQSSDMAKVSILLQAVGGTLPIKIKYEDPENPGLNSTSDELHHLLSGQSPDANGMYVPVNVTTDQYETVTGKVAQVVKTITLAKQKYSDQEMDVRSYVKHITVQAYQKGVENNPTSQVCFPDEAADAVPQCFMTSTGTEWADELQNITSKYSRFAGWVASQQAVTDWWNSDPNF